MSHESNHSSKENPYSTPFRSAFWLVIILVGLYIAGINFVAAESGGEEGKKEATEMKVGEKESQKAEATEPKQEATAKPEEKKAEGSKEEAH